MQFFYVWNYSKIKKLFKIFALKGTSIAVVCALVAQLCLTLCNPMDSSPSGSSVHGIFQARILHWVVIPFSTESSQPKVWTQVSWIAGRLFTVWATRKALYIYTHICTHIYIYIYVFLCVCVCVCVGLKYSKSKLVSQNKKHMRYKIISAQTFHSFFW